MKRRNIYDEDYYKIQFILNDRNFKRKINLLTETFAAFGCPIPKDGFNNYKQYLTWNDKYFSIRGKIEQGKKFTAEINKITKGKKQWSEKEQRKINELEKKELPPIYGENIDNILRYHGITKEDKKYNRYRDFIIEHIFFSRNEYNNAPLVIKCKRDGKTREVKMFMQIFSHTRKEDLENAWPVIKEQQKFLPKCKNKNKEYKNFHRDLEIYSIYRTFQKTLPKSKQKGVNLDDNKRVDDETCKKINKKYGDMNWETIRKIVSDVEKIKRSCGL